MLGRKAFGVVSGLALALTATGARADNFPPGSLIIPMDQCYQRVDGSTPLVWSGNQCVTDPTLPDCYARAGAYPGGNISHGYGAVYALTRAGIPVSLILSRS